MKSDKHKIGMTLVEMLIVAAVIAILATMIIGIAARINSQSNERLTENTFALLDAALSQFQEYEYNYKDPCYADFKFPLDCNDFSKSELEDILEDVLELNPGDVLISNGIHKQEYSGSEAMYFFLSRVPESRMTLDKIDKSLITNKDKDKQDMTINIDGKEYPLLRIIDPWGTTLRYDYYDEDALTFDDMKESKRAFPVITSAGPDRSFGTADDIAGR
jgi:prepilin-type N-terminal cleavage/methylation domain-containing protein